MRSVKRNISTILILAFFIIILLFAAFSAGDSFSPRSGIVINEICTENLSCLYDEYGEHPDWAELYNKGSETVDLSGFSLSDVSSGEKLWSFPEGTLIGPKGFLIVYFDGSEPEEPDMDESLSLSSFILSGQAIPEKSTGLHASFKLSEKETLCLSERNNRIIDEVNIVALKYDTSYGRESDGKGGFVRMTSTPGATNTGGTRLDYPTLSKPVFSRDSGIYSKEFDLELSSETGDIYYTLDGSEPTKDSVKYEKPIHIYDRSSEDNVYSSIADVSVELLPYIDFIYEIPNEPVLKCNVVRAAVFDKDGNLSETVTKSYIPLSSDAAFRDIGIISLVTDPGNLFDYEKGIYVIGKCGVESFGERLSESENALKFLKDNPDTPTDGSVIIEDVKMDEFINSNYVQRGSAWEREADISVFDSAHGLYSSESCGIRVKGHRTCNFPKKSLNLYGRKMYGSSKIKIPALNGSYSRLSLFAGGQDEISMVRDLLVSDITRDLSFASAGFSDPNALFINGEFWGIYRISEKTDRSFIGKMYGVDPDEVLIAKNNVLQSLRPSDEKLYGDLRHFISLADFTTGTDYERFQEMVDLDSLIDYYAARIYIDEGMDWPNINKALWRTRKTDESNPCADGRWRWINFDNNSNLDHDSVSVNTIKKALEGTKNYRPDEMFKKLMQNGDFKKRFLERFKSIAYDTFEPERSIERLEKYAAGIRPYMEKDFGRYYGSRYSLSDFDDDIANIKDFFRERAEYIIPMVEEYCRY